MFGTDIPEAWMFYADRSYVLTRLMFFSDFLFEAPVNAHRTMELYLKAYLVSNGETVAPKESAWGHNLIELKEHCSSHDISFNNNDFTRRLAYFQRYFDLVRYPTSIDNKLTDGTGIWFSFDSCIFPLDEVIAFIRPRVVMKEIEWENSWLKSLYLAPEGKWTLQKKSLINANKLLQQILCARTHPSKVDFSNFNCDLPGC